MKSFRPDKMASLIRGIVSDMIANKLNDPRISSFTSITRVEVSGDLQLAKVYISVMGSEAQERKTMAALEHARGHVQRAIAKGVTARVCPVLSFHTDRSIKKAAEIIKIIDENIPPADYVSEEEPCSNEAEDNIDGANT